MNFLVCSTPMKGKKRRSRKYPAFKPRPHETINRSRKCCRVSEPILMEKESRVFQKPLVSNGSKWNLPGIPGNAGRLARKNQGKRGSFQFVTFHRAQPQKNGSSLSGVARIDEPYTFCGGCPTPTPLYTMHAAAPEGRRGGGSVTELVGR